MTVRKSKKYNMCSLQQIDSGERVCMHSLQEIDSVVKGNVWITTVTIGPKVHI